MMYAAACYRAHFRRCNSTSHPLDFRARGLDDDVTRPERFCYHRNFKLLTFRSNRGQPNCKANPRFHSSKSLRTGTPLTRTALRQLRRSKASAIPRPHRERKSSRLRRGHRIRPHTRGSRHGSRVHVLDQGRAWRRLRRSIWLLSSSATHQAARGEADSADPTAVPTRGQSNAVR